MKFTRSWLADHLETDAGIEDIAETLTRIGLEVDEVADPAAALAGFVVAEVREAKPHPNAERLKLCRVATGKAEVEVVCGAPNARAGMKAVFAPPGARLPGTGLLLKKARIRGVESVGMLCSEKELGLSDDHSRIIELDQRAPTGAPAARALGLDDPVIDVEVTPNRGDCLGVAGIARELAAAGLGALRTPPVSPVEGAYESPIPVVIEKAALESGACALFIGRYIRGVANRESPPWLRRRLEAVGLRPISALVDITNYLTLDRARPAHVFDADRIAGGLWVGLGRAGAALAALDGKSYTLDDEMVAIGDETGVLSLAGVIGGESSACTEATRNVFLEIALFDPVRTAQTARKLGIETDARQRFERGVDPAFAVPGAELATRLILDLCGGEASALVIAGQVPAPPAPVRFRPARLSRLAGVAVPDTQARAILARLGFEIADAEAGGNDAAWRVLPPTWRHDVSGEADLVEEVMRIWGYERIPAVSMPRTGALARPALGAKARRVRTLRRVLGERGMAEAVTLSFADSHTLEPFTGGRAPVGIANPIAAHLDALRPSPLPNLLAAAARNAARGFADLALFEIGPGFVAADGAGERTIAAGVRTGLDGPRHWAQHPRAVDAFDAKADAMAALEAAGVRADALVASPEGAGDAYHPGRSGTLRLGPKVLASFGEVHPAVRAGFEIEGPAVAFEIFLDRVPLPRKRAGRARGSLVVSDYPFVERDFAFLLAREVPAAKVVAAVRKAAGRLVGEVSVFDVYEGEGVPEGRKSLALSVRLQAMDRTLSEAEIAELSRAIVEGVARATGGALRS